MVSALGVAPLRLGEAAELVEGGGQLGGPERRRDGAHGMPPVAVARGPAQGDLAVAADPDRGMRLLDGLGQAADGVEAVDSPAKDAGHWVQRVLKMRRYSSLTAPRRSKSGVARALELLAHPAHAGPDGETSAGEHVDGGEHLRGDHGIAVGRIITLETRRRDCVLPAAKAKRVSCSRASPPPGKAPLTV